MPRKRKDRHERAELQQTHRTPPQRKYNVLSPSSAMVRGRFSPESPRHSSQVLAEPSTPSYSSTVSPSLYLTPTTFTPPPFDQRPFPVRAISNLAQDFPSPPTYRSFDSTQRRSKIMEETLHPPQAHAIHLHAPNPLLATAPYSETSYGFLRERPDVPSPLIPQSYGGTETHRSESPIIDLPYCPSPCHLCHGLQATDQGTTIVYDTFDDWNVHFLKDHEGPTRWIITKCPWRECTTKVTFATLKLWLDHVRIVHQKSFYCERPGCKIALGGPNPRPFGSQADLKRHGLTKSHLAPVLCNKPGCPGKENLNRRDKRTKHALEYHGQILCTVASCLRGRHIGEDYFGFATYDDLFAHLREKHPFEDGGMLPGYGMTTPSSAY
ncbi:hypothetical protein BDZ45DRAFT_685835 [Acephala macrosclerotiorum]|nr:hypothetical protein BDZ45DRAFT_685835 [Acephala macrosclerotiorum]